jgi:hypothetical protein
LGLFFGGIRNNDSTFGHLFLSNPLNDDPIMQWPDLHTGTLLPKWFDFLLQDGFLALIM